MSAGVCPSQCGNPFDRVVVSYLLRGGTRVMWELRDDFADAQPYHFRLQFGHSSNPDADDWADVGAAVTDAFYAVDGEQRVFGQTRAQFYRVRLDTAAGTYYSVPTGVEGTMNRRDWRQARESVRQGMVRMRATAGQEGYLLKRRVTGTPCPACTDHLTGEVRNDNCLTCYGTGFRCGYFFPIDCVWAEVYPKTYRVKVDANRGTVQDLVVKARVVNPWMLGEGDVWVNKRTDDRYYVHSVEHESEIRGVPITAVVEMRPAPATDVIYALQVPGQAADDANELEGFL
jgi:hypothetical protein